MSEYIVDRGMDTLRFSGDGFPRAPRSYFGDNSPDSGADRLFSQFPPPYPGAVHAGRVFGEGTSDDIRATIEANPRNTSSQQNNVLWEVIDQLQDRLRMTTQGYHYACWMAASQSSLLAAANDPNDPFAGNSNAVASRETVQPPGLSTRNSHTNLQLSTPAGAYSSPTRRRSPIGPPMMDNVRSALPRQRIRHKRTETPEQLHQKPTEGILPQCTRGLLHDYFEDIRKWAIQHVIGFRVGEMEGSSLLPNIKSMLGEMSNVRHMLNDSETRTDIFAGLIIRHIVEYALGESALIRSGHDAGEQCAQLSSDYNLIDAEAFALKHQACLEQQELYTKLKDDVNHREWRTRAAEQRTQEILSELSGVLRHAVHPERDHELTELYIKGYRIGFRLRSEAVKWQVVWPLAGTDINMTCMINQSRNLFGDPTTTLQRVNQYPQDFVVRFAWTPTFISCNHSSGVEAKKIIHSSLVHMGVRGYSAWWMMRRPVAGHTRI